MIKGPKKPWLPGKNKAVTQNPVGPLGTFPNLEKNVHSHCNYLKSLAILLAAAVLERGHASPITKS